MVASGVSHILPIYSVFTVIFQIMHNHSLTSFLAITGVAWVVLYAKMNSDGKWGQVVGNIVSEWTQLLGLILLTKKLIEDSRRRAASREPAANAM